MTTHENANNQPPKKLGFFGKTLFLLGMVLFTFVFGLGLYHFSYDFYHSVTTGCHFAATDRIGVRHSADCHGFGFWLLTVIDVFVILFMFLPLTISGLYVTYGLLTKGFGEVEKRRALDKRLLEEKRRKQADTNPE